jgi:hypothetical protein
MTRDENVPAGAIERRILAFRGHRVILDSDLAALYGVTTKRLNEQVKRNADRFPGDFMFELTDEEAAILRSQSATSSGGHGGRRHAPRVFTEHGAVMAASVLNTPRAVEVRASSWSAPSCACGKPWPPTRISPVDWTR